MHACMHARTHTHTHTHTHLLLPPPMQPWGGVSGGAGMSAAGRAGEGHVSDGDTVSVQGVVEVTGNWDAATPTLPVVSQLQLIPAI